MFFIISLCNTLSLEKQYHFLGANLEGSNMAGVNLRVATLKNANLQNCDLRAAVLAGADLEVNFINSLKFIFIAYCTT